jgi:hypothetical protein
MATYSPLICGNFRGIGESPGIDIGAEDGSNVALVHFDPLDTPKEKTIAYARLFCAAHDLLESLKDAANQLEASGLCFDHPTIVRYRAAIAKAEGKDHQ